MTPADLRALVGQMTPGEWSAITGTRLCHLHAPSGPVAHRLLLADAEGIATLHNLAPALLAVCEAAERFAGKELFSPEFYRLPEVDQTELVALVDAVAALRRAMETG